MIPRPKWCKLVILLVLVFQCHCQTQLDDNVKLEQQSVQANEFTNFVVRFTMKQPPLGSNKIYYLVSPCSGLVTLLVSRNRLPSMNHAERILSHPSGVQVRFYCRNHLLASLVR